jgi:hypothetical protein
MRFYVPPGVPVAQVEYHWSRGNALDMYLGITRFGPRHGH